MSSQNLINSAAETNHFSCFILSRIIILFCQLPTGEICLLWPITEVIKVGREEGRKEAGIEREKGEGEREGKERKWSYFSSNGSKRSCWIKKNKWEGNRFQFPGFFSIKRKQEASNIASVLQNTRQEGKFQRREKNHLCSYLKCSMDRWRNRDLLMVQKQHNWLSKDPGMKWLLHFMFCKGTGPDSEEGRETNRRVMGSYQHHIKGLLMGSWEENWAASWFSWRLLRTSSSKTIIPTELKKVTALHKTWPQFMAHFLAKISGSPWGIDKPVIPR